MSQDKIWNDLKKELNKVLEKSSDSSNDELQTLRKDLEIFSRSNLGTPEAEEAENGAAYISDLVRSGSNTKVGGWLRQSEILVSGSPEEIREGIELLEKILEQEKNNEEAYVLLAEAVYNFNAYEEMAQKIIEKYGGKQRLEDFEHAIKKHTASSSQSELTSEQAPPVTKEPSLTENLLDKAEDFYFSGDYKQAISLYQRILDTDPGNSKALEHLEKAKAHEIAQNLDARLPREAKKSYRLARSYIAIRQHQDAASLLEKAIQIANDSGIPFHMAEELFDNLANAIVAAELREKARKAFDKDDYLNALVLYQQTFQLDPTDELTKLLADQLEEALNMQSVLQTLNSRQTNDESTYNQLKEIKEKIQTINYPLLVESQLMKSINDAESNVSQNYLNQAKTQGEILLGAIKASNNLKTIEELSEKVLELLNHANELSNSFDGTLWILISETKVIKTRVELQIKHSSPSSFFLNQLQSEVKERDHSDSLFQELITLMTRVSIQLDGKAEFKDAWGALESLLHPTTREIIATEQNVTIVFGKVKALLRRNARKSAPWILTVISVSFTTLISMLFFFLQFNELIEAEQKGFPIKFIFFASLLGSLLGILHRLTTLENVHVKDFIRLAWIRPIIGVGISEIILYGFYYVDIKFGSDILKSTIEGNWGYAFFASLIGMSDPLMEKILDFLVDGLSPVKLNLSSKKEQNDK